MLLVILTVLVLQLLPHSFVVINKTDVKTPILIDDVLNGPQWFRVSDIPFTYKTKRFLQIDVGPTDPYQSFVLVAGDTLTIFSKDSLVLNDSYRNQYYNKKTEFTNKLYDLQRSRFDPKKYFVTFINIYENQLKLLGSYKDESKSTWYQKEKSVVLSTYYLNALTWERNVRNKPKNIDKYKKLFDELILTIIKQQEFKDIFSTAYLKFAGRNSVNAYFESIKDIIEENQYFINYEQSKNIELARIKGITDSTTKSMVLHKTINSYLNYDVDWAYDLYKSNFSIFDDEQKEILDSGFATFNHLMNGKPYIPITAVNVKGDTVSTDQFLGKYIYIINWDIIYSQYLRETEDLKILQNKYGEENIIFIGLSMYKDKEGWLEMVRKQFNFGVQLHLAGEHRKQFVEDYNGEFHPRHILITPDGFFIDSNTESIVTGIETVLDSILLKTNAIKKIENPKKNY